MLATPVAQAGPARRLALGGAVVETLAEVRMERSMGLTAEPLHQGKAGRLMRAARLLTLGGAAGSLLAGRSRVVAAASGVALLAGSLCTRLGVFEAGQQSARDPRYTVVPQRERVDRGERVRARGVTSAPWRLLPPRPVNGSRPSQIAHEIAANDRTRAPGDGARRRAGQGSARRAAKSPGAVRLAGRRRAPARCGSPLRRGPEGRAGQPTLIMPFGSSTNLRGRALVEVLVALRAPGRAGSASR